MKKLLATALISMMSLTFVACGSTSGAETTYRNATYRGAYLDGSVEVELSVKDNKIESAKFRKLQYKDTDFLAEESTETTKALAGQYQSLLEHLIGKDVSAIEDLYTPGNIAKDVDGLASASIKEGEVVDTLSGATIRSGKIISALNDALNRGAYKLAE